MFLPITVSVRIHSQAQLETGSRIIDLQTFLIIGVTLPELSPGSASKTYGLTWYTLLAWPIIATG